MQSSSVNPKGGRPRGSRTKQPALTITQKRRLLQGLFERASDGDAIAMDELFTWWMMQELRTGAQA